MGLNEVSDLRGAQRGLWSSVSSVELSELSRAQGAMRSSVSSVELSKLCGVALTAAVVCHPIVYAASLPPSPSCPHPLPLIQFCILSWPPGVRMELVLLSISNSTPPRNTLSTAHSFSQHTLIISIHSLLLHPIITNMP